MAATGRAATTSRRNEEMQGVFVVERRPSRVPQSGDRHHRRHRYRGAERPAGRRPDRHRQLQGDPHASATRRASRWTTVAGRNRRRIDEARRYNGTNGTGGSSRQGRARRAAQARRHHHPHLGSDEDLRDGRSGRSTPSRASTSRSRRANTSPSWVRRAPANRR